MKAEQINARKTHALLAACYWLMAGGISANAVAGEWGGFYAGANLGMTTFRTETADYWCWHGCDVPTNIEQGLTAGIQLGHNWQLDDSFVFGFEIDYSSGGSASETAHYTVDRDHGLRWQSDWSSLLSLRARAGLSVDKTLLYITGGVARADATFKAQEFRNFPNNENYARFNDWITGYVAGAGIEHLFTRNLAVRLEYLTTQMEQVSACWADDAQINPGNCFNSGVQNDASVHWDSSDASLRFGASWKF